MYAERYQWTLSLSNVAIVIIYYRSSALSNDEEMSNCVAMRSPGTAMAVVVCVWSSEIHAYPFDARAPFICNNPGGMMFEEQCDNSVSSVDNTCVFFFLARTLRPHERRVFALWMVLPVCRLLSEVDLKRK